MRPAPGRGGFVLVLTLLLLLALTLLAHGLLTLAQTHRRAGAAAWTARARDWGARALVVREVLALDSLTRQDGTRAVTWEGGQGEVAHRVLSPELVLVESRVDSAGTSRAAGLVWALDAAVRVASLPRAVEVGRWPDAATLGRVEVEATGVDGCAPDTVPGGAGRAGVDLRDPGEAFASGEPPGLGLLAGYAIAGRLAPLPTPLGTPSPTLDGEACGDEPWNWGDPTGAVAACAGRQAAVWWPGDLRVVGGVGQGLVAVGGNLVLDDARVGGLLLVGGDLVLTGGAVLEGVARVGGELRVGDGAVVRGRPCAAHAALQAAARTGAPLSAPYVLPRPGWILY